MIKSFILSILFFSITSISYAEDITISADADRQELTLDEQITLTITVSGSASNIPNPDIPELKGFTAYSSGRSQNLSIINGQVSSSVSFTYILVPNNTGEYTLGPFSIDYKDKTYSAGPINIKVLPRSAQRQQEERDSQVLPPESEGGNIQPERGKELFIEAYVDKLRAYVNEQITLTFAVYQAVSLFDNPRYNPPSTTGFWIEDMPPQRKYYKVINNIKYLVTEIKTALFATGPGEFTIGPARLEAAVEDMDKPLPSNPFDAFDQDLFGMFKRTKSVILTTDPIKIEVMPLPAENKPVDFKGDVGDFDVSLNIDKNTVEENQPVSLKIKIKGKGNIKTISSPVVPEIQDVRSYESGSSENISKDDYVVQGEKIFEKMLIPKKEGNIIAGPIEYVYFDPVLKDYMRKKVGPLEINVTKSKERPVEKISYMPVSSKEEIQLLKRDIAYIKISPVRFRPKDYFLYKNKIFLLINILPLFILAIVYLYSLYANRLRSDIKYARSLRAKRTSFKRLKGARKIMNKNMVKEFYAEIYRAVIEYIADKLNIPHASITKESLEKNLTDIGVDNEAVSKVKILFDDCDMARFASAKFTHDDMVRTLKEAEEVIKALEKYI